MALPFQTTLRWATEADFDALEDVMFTTALVEVSETNRSL